MFELLFYTFIAVVFIQLVYHFAIFGWLAFYKPQKTIVKNEPVSVILYTKNQAEKLPSTIDILLNQQYPAFEIVIINNASTDETSDILKQYADTYPNIRIVNVKNNEAFWGSTKYALTLGIKASSYEELVFTDTNQQIVSPLWLAHMAGGFTSKKSLVMGVQLLTTKKGFLNKIIRFRYLSNQQWNISISRLSKPIGLPLDNVAYKKSTFFENKGYIRFMNYFHYTHELFFSEAANRKNTAFSLAKESFTHVESPSKFGEFIQQSVEEKSVLKELTGVSHLLKFIYLVSYLIFIILAVLLLISAHYSIYAIIAIIVFRYGFCWFINGKTYKVFGNRDLALWFPILESIDLFTQLRITLKGVIYKPLIKK